MLPEDYNYGKQTWVFRVQSPEDFYNQLRAAHREDYAREQEFDVEDTTMAQEMLQAIGIKTK
jgi:hypothetical protein